jgi:hypothetical protein
MEGGYFHSFIASALDRGEWSASGSGRFTLEHIEQEAKWAPEQA